MPPVPVRSSRLTSGGRLPSPREGRSVAPDAMQDDGELPRGRNGGLLEAFGVYFDEALANLVIG